MKCPKCQRRLRVEATTCLCGWTQSGVAQPKLTCHATPMCEGVFYACITVERKAVPACEQCYIAHHTQRLTDTNFARQREENRKRVLEIIGAGRQPGEDDEAVAA